MYPKKNNCKGHKSIYNTMLAFCYIVWQKTWNETQNLRHLFFNEGGQIMCKNKLKYFRLGNKDHLVVEE